MAGSGATDDVILAHSYSYDARLAAVLLLRLRLLLCDLILCSPMPDSLRWAGMAAPSVSLSPVSGLWTFLLDPSPAPACFLG